MYEQTRGRYIEVSAGWTKLRHGYKKTEGNEIYDVETFNTGFNTEAYRLIKSIEQSATYTFSSDKQLLGVG